MSSKKFVYLLMMLAIVCGFIASDAAHGQSTGSLSFKGTVMEADGTPAPGYAITGETVPANPAFTLSVLHRVPMAATTSLPSLSLGRR